MLRLEGKSIGEYVNDELRLKRNDVLFTASTSSVEKLCHTQRWLVFKAYLKDLNDEA